MEPGRNHRTRAALLEAGRAMGRAFSVRELHAAALPHAPRLGLTTAYRAVERCDAHGHHHHLVCVQCGATSVLEGCALEPTRAASAAAGFELLDRELGALPARCGECAEPASYG